MTATPTVISAARSSGRLMLAPATVAVAHSVQMEADSEPREWADPQSALTRAIELNPDNIDWWYDRAVSRTFLGKYALAIEDATKAIELDPEYEFSYVARARGKLGLNDRLGALEDYNLAESIDRTNPDIYAERSQLLINMGHTEEALDDANTLIEMAPDVARSYLRRAEVYLKSERWDEALRDLDRCEVLEPDDETTWRLRASAYYFSGRFDEAVDAYGYASELNPQERLNYLYRANALVRLNRHQEAVTTLTRWITTAQPTEMGYLRRGGVYQEMGEDSLAIADYRSAIKLNPVISGYANLWIAILLAEAGDTAQAEGILEELTTDINGAWIALIAAHMLDRLPADDVFGAASNDEQRAEAQYYVGVASELAGDVEAAMDAYRRCIELGAHDLFELEFSRARLAVLASRDLPSGS